jgi:hypothetical protein
MGTLLELSPGFLGVFWGSPVAPMPLQRGLLATKREYGVGVRELVETWGGLGAYWSSPEGLLRSGRAL